MHPLQSKFITIGDSTHENILVLDLNTKIPCLMDKLKAKKT